MNEKSSLSKKVINILAVIIGAILVFALVFNYGYARADGGVQLSSGSHQNWVDRIDCTGAEYARDFYDWLIENSDGDGVEDALIDGSLPNITVRTLEGTTYFDPSASGTMQEKAKAVVEVIATQNQKESFDYISSAFYAFDRDFPQVFWLSGQISLGSKYSFRYYNNGKVEYTQEISFRLNEDGFDIRANDYKNKDYIYEQIGVVNSAVNSITSGVDADASRYEKVEYFNDWLTENNAYANNIGENSRDCRGALLGQDANSAYAPVCEGYARAFKLLCDKAEIPCTLVSGDAKGEAHMWAIVQMENGEWYGVDTTWNDPTVSGVHSKKSGSENHDYLLVGANTMIDGYAFSSSHIVQNKPSQNSIEFLNQPEISQEKYGAAVLENEWDISVLNDGSVKAELYQAEGHTLLNPAYKLIIKGNGEMKSYASPLSSPWILYSAHIVEIEIRSNITAIGQNAFCGFTSLEKVTVLGETALPSGSFENCKSGFEIFAHSGYGVYQSAINFGFNAKSLCQIDEWTVTAQQSCEIDEKLSGCCATCNFVAEKVGKLAYGHDFGEWTLKTNPTQTQSGHAQRVCANDGSHIETYELPNLQSEKYAYTLIDPAQCEKVGREEYLYNENGVQVRVEVEIPALEHEYGAPTYAWEYAYKKCVATAKCIHNESHTLVEEGVVTASEEVDCQTSGEVTFTATFTNSHFTTQVDTVVFEPTDHSYSTEWSYSQTEHWKECKCGAKTENAEHNYGDWVEEISATVFKEGLKTRECECGSKQTEVVAKIDFIQGLFSGTLDEQTKNLLIAGGGVLATIIFLTIIILLFRKKPKTDKTKKK